MQRYIETVKGFTLIELLVVIAILVVLSVVVILTLNPAELLRQARDSTRLSDMATMKSAVALYLADVAQPTLGDSTRCYVHSSSTLGVGTRCGPAGVERFLAGTNNVSSSIAVDTSGWMPVNFAGISGGSPIAAVPTDPTNNATLYYAYRVNPANTTQYEFNMKLESLKYASTTSQTDGGNLPDIYEGGTLLSL